MNRTNAPSEPDLSNWLCVADVAAQLGVSARAVQKRCALGKMAARRVAVPGGVRWEVDASSLSLEGREPSREPANQQDANPANQGREPANQNGSFGSRPGSFDAQEAANLDANPRTEGREPTNEPTNQTNELRELLARERELTGFLRGLIEQRDRDAAELRAALREALKIAPRQLAARESSTTNAPATEPRAPGGDADELSADELLELCGRICAR